MQGFLLKIKRRLRKRQTTKNHDLFYDDHVFLEKRLTKKFLLFCICMSICNVFVCLDLTTIPEPKTIDFNNMPLPPGTTDLRNKPLFFIHIGDGVLTALENIVTTISFLWAWMLFVDVLDLLDRLNKSKQFIYFFGSPDIRSGSVE